MSERPEGIAEGVVPEPRESAVVIVARKSAAGEWEVLMGLRSRRSGFFPSNWAFPGGGLEESDEPHRRGAHARCAARELREETGVEIAPDALLSIGFKTTPPFHPIRYRTEFFVTLAPPGLTVPSRAPTRENEELRFLAAGEALEQWERGAIFFPPPLPPLLRVFARERTAKFESLPRLLAVVGEYEERVPRVEFVPSVWMYPVLSPTLPPATHTNVWLAGGSEFVIVDPGATEGYDINHLMLVIERRTRMGSKPRAIVLTHHHRDHVAGAPALAERLGIPIRAHRDTAAVLAERGFPVAVAGDIEDGTTLDLGGVTLIAHHTPGHTMGHILLEVPERRVAISGDLLSGFSTILIHPDEGDMDAYLASLEKTRQLDISLLLPSHGPPMLPDALGVTIAHRLAREEKVVAALAAGPLRLPELATIVYEDTPGAPPMLTGLQVRAHLVRLERAGRVVVDGDVISLSVPDENAPTEPLPGDDPA